MKQALYCFLFWGLCFGLKAQCPTPTNFSASNITTSSIDIDWSASGPGPMEIEYGVLGFTIGTGINQTTTQNIITLSNLAPATTYRVFIRRQCSGSFSPWNSFTFTTTCGSVISAPVRFDFEGSAWQSPASSISRGTLDTCWVVSPQNANTFWSVGPPHETSLSTGPVGDHSTGYGAFLHLNGLGISQDSSARLQSPAIDLFGLVHPRLEFWYHMFGASIDSLEIMAKFSAAPEWDTLYTFYGQQQFSQEDPWQSQTISLSNYLDSVVYIQFVGYGQGVDVQIALDDLSIYDLSDCSPPSFFHNVSNNDTSALLAWDQGSALSHTIEYGIKGFSLGTGTQITVGSAPFRINGLAADTTYEFYLRGDCSPGQASPWTPVLLVKTDCAPVYGAYFEDFEGSAWPKGGLEACWDRWDYEDYKWNVGPPNLSYVQSGPGTNQVRPSSAQFIVAHRPNAKGKARTSICSPLIDLDTISDPELKFWTHMFGLHISAFDIAIDSGDGFKLLKRIVGSQQISKTEAWQEEIISLAPYGGKVVKVKFTGIASNNWASLSRIAVDDFGIDQAPPCRKPTNLQAIEVGFTSATVNWLSGGSNNWLIRLKPAGGTSIITPVSANPLVLSQLSPGTEYTLWVKDSCAVGDVSGWSSALEFKTYCLPDSAPYFQDFEGSQFVVRTSWFNLGILHPCWSRSHEIGPLWQPSPATSFANNLLPTADHTTGSGKYMGGTLYLGNGTNEPTSFTSPHIDLSGLSAPELSFWYFLGGYFFNTNQIQVEINNGSGWTNISTILGPQQLSTTSAWIEEVVDISAYANDTIQLRFISLGNSLYAATAGGIDDISIHDNPTCLPPSNLQSLSISSDGAMVNWTSGGANKWIVRLRPEGGNFQILSAARSDSFALSGLLSNTSYEIWVRDSCGPDVSIWHGPLYFRTDCLPTSVPYYENFDSPSWLPSLISSAPGQIDECWRRSDTVEKVWIPKSGASGSASSGPSGSRSGNGNYMMNSILSSSTSTAANLLSSPPIINSGLQDPELNYWYHLYGAQIQKLKVYLQKADGTMHLIDSLIGQQQSSGSAAWQQRSVALNAFMDDTIKIVFAAYSGNSGGTVNMAIDEVEIIDRSCSGPQNLSANAITANSANLSWITGSTNSSIQHGLSGFNLGSGTVVNGLNPNYLLSGLQAFTTYDFYVQDSCRALNSAWSGPHTFTTFCMVPSASFSSQGSSLNLNFDASASQGNHLQYQWDFGDGNTALGINPSHNYLNPGFYTVQLVITDTCGQRDTVQSNLQVCAAPQAVINYSRNGLNLSFDARSSSGANSYYWNFGAYGSANTDTATVSFPAKGSYPVYLVVTNACGQSDTLFINLLICDQPVASLSVTKNLLNNLLYVNFDATASTFTDSFLWDFGDGTQDSTTLTPLRIYPNPNINYQVTLITRADCGLSDTIYYQLNGIISTSELGDSKLNLYPNPAEEQVSLVSENESLLNKDFFLVDISGRSHSLKILSRSESKIVFDVSDLASGEYFLVDKDDPHSGMKLMVR